MMVNTHILIYKNVFDFIFEFDIFIKLNGNETTTYKGNILIQRGFKRVLQVYIGIILSQIFSLLETIFYSYDLYDFYE